MVLVYPCIFNIEIVLEDKSSFYRYNVTKFSILGSFSSNYPLLGPDSWTKAAYRFEFAEKFETIV
jgi:hypothetical protein